MSETLKYAFKRRFPDLFSGPVETWFINLCRSSRHNTTGNAASLNSRKSGFPGFLILYWCFFDQVAIKETHGTTLRLVWPKAFHRGLAVLAQGHGFFAGHISAGLAFWLFSLLFLSFYASPIFMLKLTFELLPHCPPFFIENNYPWYFGSGGLLCLSHLEQSTIRKMPKYFLITRNDNSLNLKTPMQSRTW